MAYLKVRVTTGARGDAVVGWEGTSLKVRVRAAPEKGKANEAVCRLIARRLGVPVSAVAVERGHASRGKLLLVDGLTEEELRQRLLAPS